jgi:hypothetical protein
MEPEGSLPCSQEPSTGPYPEADKFSPYHPILSKICNMVMSPARLWPESDCAGEAQQYVT